MGVMSQLTKRNLVVFHTRQHHYDSFLPHVVQKVIGSCGQIIGLNDARMIAGSGRVRIDGEVVSGADYVVSPGQHEFYISEDEFGGGYCTPNSMRVLVTTLFFDKGD